MGEPDLEKIQLAAHEQMEMLKQKTKDNVSGSNVAMPKNFLKPLDYNVQLLVRTHPTLRKYEKQVENGETDPEYHLYPKQIVRTDLKDDIVLKNIKKDEDRDVLLSMTKSVGGAFIDELSISNQEIPGNFGVRILESMPTNIRNVFVPQRKNIPIEYKCDYRNE